MYASLQTVPLGPQAASGLWLWSLLTGTHATPTRSRPLYVAIPVPWTASLQLPSLSHSLSLSSVMHSCPQGPNPVPRAFAFSIVTDAHTYRSVLASAPRMCPADPLVLSLSLLRFCHLLAAHTCLSLTDRTTRHADIATSPSKYAAGAGSSEDKTRQHPSRPLPLPSKSRRTKPSLRTNPFISQSRTDAKPGETDACSSDPAACTPVPSIVICLEHAGGTSTLDTDTFCHRNARNGSLPPCSHLWLLASGF
ncbi:hypothetical protein OH76DRAFT_537444 [Lentinus brumalis]|uniref:Uncharacterized protein n=1 Tax=Lentinus brumalis TaxID=2498619 RepID=A0A371DAG7_9APHY|nr:hypothetical protein OH76DRAFT_537444 [Polyporus brumalis]